MRDKLPRLEVNRQRLLNLRVRKLTAVRGKLPERCNHAVV